MPEAEVVDTPNPPAVEVGLSLRRSTKFGDEIIVSVRRQPDEQELLLACQAVMVRGESMTLLGQAVADLPPTAPRHEAWYATIDRVRPDWLAQMDWIAAISARGAKGLTAKAALVASLVERDDSGRVQEPPALRVAASLADDLLGLGSG